jgi:hypothetical protein
LLGDNEANQWKDAMKRLILLILTIICFGAGVVFGQSNFNMDWFTIDGGGGTSTGGVSLVTGTIGQPDAGGLLAGGSFSLAGGFWSLVTVVQMPDSPLLTITLTATNSALVSWPSPSPGFTLQQNTSLNTTNWVAAPQIVTNNGTINYIIVNQPSGARFYRLIYP